LAVAQGQAGNAYCLFEYPVNMPHRDGPVEGETSRRESVNIPQPAGLKGNRLQKRLAGSHFVTFSVNRITIGL
jgi:hypothetical protein